MISEATQELIRNVSAQPTVRESVIALMSGIAAQVQVAAGNRAAVEAVVADMNDITTSLAQAVENNASTPPVVPLPAEAKKPAPKKTRKAKKGK